MSYLPNLASGLIQGMRKNQQDAILTHRHGDLTMMILSDGIGGAVGGDLASRVITRTVFEVLKPKCDQFLKNETAIPASLKQAAKKANSAIGDIINNDPALKGMGGTLLIVIANAKNVFWLSIGDSLIYRLRAGSLDRLNELHSLTGKVDAETSDRISQAGAKMRKLSSNTITSAITGKDIKKIDLPNIGKPIQRGDVFLLASDGLETIQDSQIASCLALAEESGAAKSISELINKTITSASQTQDNMSASVLLV